ncbi:hypothetical protein [Oceanobacillus sp. E9]|uniref:hypothetical protein n=1 Tax=Oceanobacillus sp. E9 TaxID=1742575 RepID=UPI00143C4773|nr:hypothetical protein [Oceanobacillus sp. E9]
MAQLENETEVERRKQKLIRDMHKLGIYYTSDGRKLEEVSSLYTLEWTNIQALNQAVK